MPWEWLDSLSLCDRCKLNLNNKSCHLRKSMLANVINFAQLVVEESTFSKKIFIQRSKEEKKKWQVLIIFFSRKYTLFLWLNRPHIGSFSILWIFRNVWMKNSCFEVVLSWKKKKEITDKTWIEFRTIFFFFSLSSFID